jgi:hypothetical protein
MHNNRFASSRSSRIPKLTITARRAGEQDAMPTCQRVPNAIAPNATRQRRLSFHQTSCQHIASFDISSEPPPMRERDNRAPQANRHSQCLMSIESNSLIHVHINRSASSICSRIIELTIATRRINKNDSTPTSTFVPQRATTSKEHVNDVSLCAKQALNK